MTTVERYFRFRGAVILKTMLTENIKAENGIYTVAGRACVLPKKSKLKKAGSWSEKRRAAALERQRKQLMTILPHYEQGCTIAEIRDLTGIAYATIQQRLSEYKKVLNNG